MISEESENCIGKTKGSSFIHLQDIKLRVFRVPDSDIAKDHGKMTSQVTVEEHLSSVNGTIRGETEWCNLGLATGHNSPLPRNI